MSRGLLGAFWLALAAGVAIAGECPVVVPLGIHDVKLTSYYAHKIPGRSELAEAEWTETAVGPITAIASSHRYPIGHQWWIDGELVETCGELLLFESGFEIGTTSRWTTTKGE